MHSQIDFRPVEDDEISGKQKLDMVSRLVDELTLDIKTGCLLPHDRWNAIQQLKVSARDFRNAWPLYTPEGIGALIHYGFNTPSPSTSQAALQCLANALLSGGARARTVFVDSGYSIHAVARLKNPKRDDEFLISRILFLTAYGTSQDFAYLVDNCHLAEYINENIARHAKYHSKLGKKYTCYEQDRALSETLRLIFVITHFCKHHIDAFHKSINSMIKILSHRNITLEETRVTSNLLGCLSSLNFDCKKAYPSKSELKTAIEKLVQILDQALRTTTMVQELESGLIPTLTVLTRLGKESSSDVKALMRKLLLAPPAQDIRCVAGTNYLMFNQDLPSYRLIQLVRIPRSEKLKSATYDLLQEVSGLDRRDFDRVYIGTDNNEDRKPLVEPRTTSKLGFENTLFRINTTRALDRFSTRSQPSLRSVANASAARIIRKPVRPAMIRTKSDTAIEALSGPDRLKGMLQTKSALSTTASPTESFAMTVDMALSLLEQTNEMSDESRGSSISHNSDMKDSGIAMFHETT